ncbi:MAG: hypothetical protein HZA50_08490 [Planctomycetes bacterium]|nr:hypothetical protein [Planctomycetota bacterium]
MLIPSDLPWNRSAPDDKPKTAGLPDASREPAKTGQDQAGGQNSSPVQPEPQSRPAQPEPQSSQSPPSTPAPEQARHDSSADQVRQDAAPSAQAEPSAPPAEPSTQIEQPVRQMPVEQAPQGPTVVVRYGQMSSIGEFRHNLSRPPRFCQKVVVRTERGVEIGQVVSTVCDEQIPLCLTRGRLGEYLAANGSEYPFKRGGKVLRLANTQDLIEQRHLEGSAREAAAYSRQQIRELNLPMKLVTVEYLLGGEKIIFYFSSESRVDFRELVRRLASQYRTRVEMRQVGSRDEARLVGDYERCGQRCCCQQYLKDLKPVSMRMAKVQKATLDPTKISGRCGRLMCCLRYEDDVYSELRTRLPRKNTWVRTEKFLGRVVDGQILTQLVKIALLDGEQVIVANEEIVERDVPAPPMPADQPGQQQAKGQSDRPRSNIRGGDRSGRQGQPRQTQLRQDQPAPQAGGNQVEPDDAGDAVEPSGGDEPASPVLSDGQPPDSPADYQKGAPPGDEMDEAIGESRAAGQPQDIREQAPQQNATQPAQQNQQPRQEQSNQRPSSDQQFRHGRNRGRRRRRGRGPGGPQQNRGGPQQNLGGSQQNPPPSQGN